jgi:hypothetical protein
MSTNASAAWLIAPAAAIGALLFLALVGEQRENRELEKKQFELSQLEHRQNFSSVWNGEKISAGPSAAEIENTKKEVEVLKEKAALARAKTDAELNKIRNDLENAK